MAVGEMIAVARTRRGFTQAKLAQNAGLDVSHLSRIERGVTEPTFGTVERLVGAMGLTIPGLYRVAARGA